MSQRSQLGLSETQLRARSEAVTSTLRRFGRIDDFDLSRLFSKVAFPHLKDVVRVIKAGLSVPVPGVPADYIAKAIYKSVAESENCIIVSSSGSMMEVPIYTIKTEADVVRIVELCLDRFQFQVREQKGHKLISGKEEESQILFALLATDIAAAHGVDMSREVETGRGPVDFKASCGVNARVMIEMKRVSNTAFWDGLKQQVPIYLVSGEIKCGYFVPILQDGDSETKLKKIQSIANQLSTKHGLQIHVKTIDARTPLSASKVKSK